MKNNYDLELVEMARQGDTEAIDRLLLQCQPDLMRFARRVCATPEDVEDAVQETLWIASRKIGTLRTAAAFATWSFRVVQRECYRLFNMTRRETTMDLLDESCLVVAEDGQGHAQLKTDVVAALAKLPAAHRQVLVMRDLEEKSAPEVAAELGITIQTVKSRLHRARLALRGSLGHWIE